jgi:hypothetical protein
VDDDAALLGDKRIARIEGFDEVVAFAFIEAAKKEGTNVKPTFCHETPPTPEVG